MLTRAMLTDDALLTLREIEEAIAFDDDKRAAPLVIEGYVEKIGDLYQLTPKGEKALLDNGAALIVTSDE